MDIHPDESIAIFIDGANLYSSTRALGFDIDYKKLLELFATQGRLVRAFYYTALMEDQEYSSVRPLVDWLDYNGYTLVTKPAKEMTDAIGRRRIKGNKEIEITVDIMEMAGKIDHIVLFSGDGDFRRLVEAVQLEGGTGQRGLHAAPLPPDGGGRVVSPVRHFHRASGTRAASRARPPPNGGADLDVGAAGIEHGGCRLTRRRRRRHRRSLPVSVRGRGAARRCRQPQPPVGPPRERAARARR